MKSYISKFFMGAALIASTGMMSCTGDLDQEPKDPNLIVLTQDNAKEFLAGMAANCYSGLSLTGQKGPGDSNMSGLDAGTSQWSRCAFYLEDMTTDINFWIYSDAGVPDLVKDTWDSNNVIVYGAYSRMYVHIAICNNFIRTVNNLGDYGVSPDAELQANIDQWKLEARALRDFSYFWVINWFGAGAYAWDDMAYGQKPQQAESRTWLYNKVVADLEDVLANFPDTTPEYGRIGKDGIEGLLCKFYLNAEVFTGTPAYDKVWSHAQNIIARHQGSGFTAADGTKTGLVKDYLSLFCGNNDMFFPGRSGVNEILFGLPYDDQFSEAYGGTTVLIAGATKDASSVDPSTSPTAGFCNKTWYGLNGAAWGCMLARKQFSDKFGFVGGKAIDKRAALWLTDRAGYTIENENTSEWGNGYANIKFTNVLCEADGTMPIIYENPYGIAMPGVQPVNAAYNFANADLPVIRLADIYLMAAEASLNGAGDVATGLKYANYVRERAGVTDWNAAEFNLSNILDERARELYQENNRRTDLIRHNKFTGSAYNWTLKGGAHEGTYLDAYRNLYPIPATVISAYGSAFKQNPNY